mmetsp:Transcript_28389/g.84052  ORF Transcript_28389/g.84052 Transcript_28389/m.84052 type:complete len:687 (-) Transcript_28389:1778-3838(-)
MPRVRPPTVAQLPIEESEGVEDDSGSEDEDGMPADFAEKMQMAMMDPTFMAEMRRHGFVPPLPRKSMCVCPDCRRVSYQRSPYDDRDDEWTLEQKEKHAEERKTDEFKKAARERFLKHLAVPTREGHEFATRMHVAVDVFDAKLEPSKRTLHNSLTCPAGVVVELEYKPASDMKWRKAKAEKGWVENLMYPLTGLKPDTKYSLRARLGMSGAHTWSGHPDWKEWGPVVEVATCAAKPSQRSGGKKAASANAKRDSMDGGAVHNGDGDGDAAASQADEAASDGSGVLVTKPDFFCHVCSKQMDNHQQWESHIMSIKHQRNVMRASQPKVEDAQAGGSGGSGAGSSAAAAAPPPPPPPRTFDHWKQYYCAACGIQCNGPSTWSDHIAGKNHQQAVARGVNTASAPPPRKVCIHFVNGSCFFGAKCKFHHDVEARRQRQLATGATSAQVGDGQPVPAFSPVAAAVAMPARAAAVIPSAMVPQPPPRMQPVAAVPLSAGENDRAAMWEKLQAQKAAALQKKLGVADVAHPSMPVAGGSNGAADAPAAAGQSAGQSGLQAAAASAAAQRLLESGLAMPAATAVHMPTLTAAPSLPGIAAANPLPVRLTSSTNVALPQPVNQAVASAPTRTAPRVPMTLPPALAAAAAAAAARQSGGALPGAAFAAAPTAKPKHFMSSPTMPAPQWQQQQPN